MRIWFFQTTGAFPLTDLVFFHQGGLAVPWPKAKGPFSALDQGRKGLFDLEY